MKTVFALFLCVTCLAVTTCGSQRSDNSESEKSENDMAGKPIKSETSHIRYTEFSNSGLAITTKYDIYRDSLVWDYLEMRNDCHLRDVVKFNPKLFDELVASLSKLKFSAKDTHDASSGGDGYAYAFFAKEKDYFHFNSSYKTKGDIDKLMELIQGFIDEHPTDAELEFNRLSLIPHEKATLGEFRTLPQELQKFSVPK